MGSHLAEYRSQALQLSNIDKILTILTGFLLRISRRDDDFADRLSRKHTAALLWIFAFITSAQMFVGNTITCWAPKEFHKSHIKYTNNFCWLQNTYYLPWTEHIPKPYEKKQIILYYQWVPFILMVQALCFSVPGIIWGYLNKRSGINTKDIHETALQLQYVQRESNRTKWLAYIKEQFVRSIKSRTGFRPTLFIDIKQLIAFVFCNCFGRDRGNYLVVLSLFCKILYIGNIVAQVFCLDIILGNEFHRFGVDFICGLFDEERWERVSSYFPRVSMCDMNIRRLGNIHRYTVQCVLPINIFTSKIYLFLWFWFVLVFIVTVFKFVQCVLFMCLTCYRNRFISKLLDYHSPETLRQHLRGDYEKAVRKFVTDYLKADGILLIKLILNNTNFITASDILKELWTEFVHDMNERRLIEEHKKKSSSRRKLIAAENV